MFDEIRDDSDKVKVKDKDKYAREDRDRKRVCPMGERGRGAV